MDYRQPSNRRGDSRNLQRKGNEGYQHKKVSGTNGIRLFMQTQRKHQGTTMKHLFNIWLQGQHMVTTIMANSAQQAASVFIARNDLEIAEDHPDLNIKQIY